MNWIAAERYDLAGRIYRMSENGLKIPREPDNLVQDQKYIDNPILKKLLISISYLKDKSHTKSLNT